MGIIKATIHYFTMQALLGMDFARAGIILQCQFGFQHSIVIKRRAPILPKGWNFAT